MEKSYDYVQNFYDAYHSMREKAVGVMKDYGKTLDVLEEGKRLLMNEFGYEDESQIYEDELEDWKCQNVYSCVFEDKHGGLYPVNVIKVRYDERLLDLEVYLESDDGYISGWFPSYCIGFEKDAIYMTVLSFLP